MQQNINQNGNNTAPHEGRFILLTGKDKLITKLLRYKFELLGYTVYIAKDGLSAWKAAKTDTYDLAIIDHELSFLSGIELLERICADERIDLPAILLIPNDDANIVARAFELGAKDTIRLPLRIEELIVRSQRTLRAQAQKRKGGFRNAH